MSTVFVSQTGRRRSMLSRADAQGSEPRVTKHKGVCGLTGEVTDSSSGPEENTDRTSQKCEEYERCSHEGLVPVCQYSEMFRQIRTSR